ncbi:MAG: pilus assembly protein [Streptosporangiales bacterium]|nr:pilus assembly protein [Streptosporangiales bacterium]
MRLSVRGGAADRGMSAVEVAILAPVIVLFLLFLVGLGRLVEARGQVDAAARDAARAATVQRDAGSALQAAERVAATDLSVPRGDGDRGWCDGQPSVSMTGDYAPGGVISVEVSCSVRLDGLGWIGFDPRRTISAEASASLDTFRRVG